ncbi:glucose-1-phosphate thymidylyltransferase [bacterium]|nr:glucose-1-phosphate thymidylyltransferase [bacterium]
MNYILFDDVQLRQQLLPFTFTRPIADIRLGIDTIREKWERFLGQEVSILTETYLSEKYPLRQADDNILINAAVLPDKALVQTVMALKVNQALSSEDLIIAHRIKGGMAEGETVTEEIEYERPVRFIENNWDIFLLNAGQIKLDVPALTAGRKSQPLSATNRVIGGENIFVEPGARVEMAMLNASEGPIYIGKDAEIMEGAMLRGPLVVGEASVIKMGAKIYGGTTIGPHCKVGGEVSNAVIFGYSNKAHDGFLGNAVLGEWCNLGADTNNSNLKNDYSTVKVWSYAADAFVPTGEQFCGLFMGDHSKTAINTMFNTGTVVGVSANVAAAGFPRQFIPSFTWAGKPYPIDKALETARQMYGRRHKTLTEADEAILREVYETTHHNRNKK